MPIILKKTGFKIRFRFEHMAVEKSVQFMPPLFKSFEIIFHFIKQNTQN